MKQTEITNSSTITNQPINIVDCDTTPLKKPRKKYIKKNLIPQQGRKIGHWSQNQKINYYIFLQKHQKHFLNSQLRRTDKIFKEMASSLGSRAADQCRSHHQKMQKKYGSFIQILMSLRDLYSHQMSDEIYKNEDQIVTNINSPQSQDFEIEMDIKKLNFDEQNFGIDLEQVNNVKYSNECMVLNGQKELQMQNNFTQYIVRENGQHIDIVDLYLN